MQRTRGNDRGQAYIDWQRERALEIEQENAAAQAAQAQALANDPAALYAATANAEADQNRELVLTGVLSDEYLQSFGTIVREPFNEAQVQVAMNQFMANTPDYIQTKPNAAVLIEFLYRNNISPAAYGSYVLAHAILTLWNGYPDLEKSVVQPEPEVATEPTSSRINDWRPSEQFQVNQITKDTVIGVVNGQKITERLLENMGSREERYYRRVLEHGNSGSAAYQEFVAIKDAQWKRDQDIAAKAAAEAEEERR